MGDKVRIGDIFDLRMGKTPPRKVLKYWNNGDHDWVSIADLGTYDKYVGITKETISDVAVSECKMKPVPSHTLLMSFKLSIGKTAITICPTYTNEAIMAFLDKGVKELDLDYLYHQFSSKDWLRDTNKAVMGATLNKGALNDSWIVLPDVEEQHRVARRLNNVSRLIEQAKLACSKYDDLIQSRFIEMFEHCHFESVLSGRLMPSMRNGVSPSKRGSIPARVLTLSAITQGNFDVSASKEGFFDVEPPAEKRISVGDFYMCRGNGNKHLVGAGEYSLDDYPNLVFPDTIIAGRVNGNLVNMPYLAAAWKRPAVRKQIESMARTTNGTYKVNQHMLSNVLLPLPPLELQNEFATFVAKVESLKTTAQQTVDRLQTLYDSLTQQYFA